MAEHLVRVDDDGAELPAASPSGNKIFAFEITVPEKFGDYQGRIAGVKGIKGDVVGRNNNNGAISYSFPMETKTKLIGDVPLSAVREELKAINPEYVDSSGHGNFDLSGWGDGSKAIRNAFVKVLEQRTEAPAVERPGGGTEPPPPRGSRRLGSEAAGAEAVDPAFVQAQQTALDRPDIQIPVGTDAEGATVFRSVRDFLNDEGAAAAKLREESSLVRVAADCLMGI